MVDSGESNRSHPKDGVIMSEFEKQKTTIISQLRNLCAHCNNGVTHTCKVQVLAREVNSLSGVPLIVNDRFSGLLLTRLVS